MNKNYDTFTESELRVMHELVLKEEHKIRRKVENDCWRNAYKILRPGLLRKLSVLLEIDRKLSELIVCSHEGEQKDCQKS